MNVKKLVWCQVKLSSGKVIVTAKPIEHSFGNQFHCVVEMVQIKYSSWYGVNWGDLTTAVVGFCLNQLIGDGFQLPQGNSLSDGRAHSTIRSIVESCVTGMLGSPPLYL